ncbi:MKI67 FHA domain-interacting nucleolar phosphoprotein [Schizosaccharomyces octosporus yFS286]|uniref:MKI67 FHA domain-interacting nucleolar phosphoprotein n=1 Tax=Schizosaccharomyces octosporus (strain yFS286) TaxID=483514 RepID=S9RC93_SCHOY|nr:MKI67 FHA domain-interacting nucleolar phosphoprotein [Schizosaccharomyces octosporus yFS286]EPX71744.1 MKI67 FHA domain-interacting nucleolar phosphoprotein [Schizosaccharomyces octosporus yFS286]
MSKTKQPTRATKKQPKEPKATLQDKKVNDVEKTEPTAAQEGAEQESMNDGNESEEVLKGFESSGDEDESDAEIDNSNIPSKPIMALGNEKEKKIKKKVSEKKGLSKQAGVLYVGRLPHGFHEKQLEGYFSQFGAINRLRLSRNKKTGNSKHYAFIEFESVDVANIVAETMHNYLLYGRLLQCKVVPKDKVHGELFKGASQPYKRIPRATIARLEHQKPLSGEKVKKLVARHNRKLQLKKRKLEQLGITLDSDVTQAKAESVKKAAPTKKSNKKKKQNKQV